MFFYKVERTASGRSKTGSGCYHSSSHIFFLHLVDLGVKKVEARIGLEQVQKARVGEIRAE